jgi:hypothetical protein
VPSPIYSIFLSNGTDSYDFGFPVLLCLSVCGGVFDLGTEKL